MVTLPIRTLVAELLDSITSMMVSPSSGHSELLIIPHVRIKDCDMGI